MGYLEEIGVLQDAVIRRLAFQSPLLTACGLLALNAVAFTASGVSFSLPYIAQVIFGIVPIIAVVLCTAEFVRAPNSTTRLLSRLGDASYSTYLLHPLVIIPIVAIYLRIPAALHNPLVFVASAITCQDSYRFSGIHHGRKADHGDAPADSREPKCEPMVEPDA